MIVKLTITDDNGGNKFNATCNSLESLEMEQGRFERHFYQKIKEADESINKSK